MKTPESASEITVEWLRNALAWECPDCEPVSVEVEPDVGGPSLLGKIARVKLNYTAPGCGPSSMIVKFQARSSEWEAQIYRLLSEAGVHSVPHIFGAFEHGTLIMEDLSQAKRGSQAKGCTLQQAEDVLSVLAEIHAYFWGDPRVPSIQPEQFSSAIRVNMDQSWRLFKSRYGEMLGNAVTDFEWLWHNANTVSEHRISEPTTLFHGDVHPENLLFRRDGKGEPVLLDWQLGGKGLAANDISFFLVKSLTVEQRRANEDLLLSGYLELLPKRVRTEYGYDRFKLDYRACVTRSMMSAVMLVGPRFAARPDRFELADLVATRVIAAVRDLSPADAIRQRRRL